MTRRHENFTIKFVIFVTCKLQLSGVIFDSRSSSGDGGAAAAALLSACGSAVGRRRAVLVFKHVYLHRGQKSLVLTKRLTAATAMTAARR